MPLLVPNDSTYMTYVLPDLLKVVGGDTSIADTSEGVEAGYLLISYGYKQPGFAQGQFANIVSPALNYAILLQYVQSSFELPDDVDPDLGRVPTIADRQGATYGPGMGTANPAGSSRILVYVDAYNCNGANYWVKAVDGTHIFSPRWVIVFHELTHALHIALGQVTDTTPEADENKLTIGDENRLRAQYHPKFPWLKQRSLDEVGACGAVDPDPNVNAPTASTNNPRCYIVTAATGSPYAAEVQRLQAMRDSVLRGGPLGAAIVDELLEEYYQFSPRVANDMRESESLREGVAVLTVWPLLEFLALVEARVMPTTDGHFSSLVEQSFRSTMIRLGTSRIRPSGTHEIAPALRRLSEQLCLPGGDAPIRRIAAVEVEVRDAASVLDYLGSVVRLSSPRRRFLGWAIARPLATYWTTLGAYRASESRVAALSDFGPYLDAWLADVPVPSSLSDFSFAALQAGFRHLAATVFRQRAVREVAATRFLGVRTGQSEGGHG